MKASQYLFLIIVEVFGKDQKKKKKNKKGGRDHSRGDKKI